MSPRGRKGTSARQEVYRGKGKALGRAYPKKVIKGVSRKSKFNPLRCSICGRWFPSLAVINAHYTAVGHKRRVHPPKPYKFDTKSYTQAEVAVAQAIVEALKDPLKWRVTIKEMLKKKAWRDRTRW